MQMYLNERSWVDLLEKGLTAYLTWPKRNEQGHYGERYKDFSNILKCTRLFVFGDEVMQSLAPSPVFTDGINIYIHEQTANECWQGAQDQEMDAFRPIYYAVMKSIEIVLTDPPTDGNLPWKTVEYVPFVLWFEKLKKARATEWLKRLGYSIKTTPKEIEQVIQARTDLVNWFVPLNSKIDGAPEEPISPPAKQPIWVNEVEKLVKTRWEDCVWRWEEDAPMTYQRWTIQWMLAERLGRLIGEARNEIAINGTETKILKEGWGAAMSGWAQTLKAMIISGDWVSFGRSMLSFVQICHEHETLTFDEKTDITGVAARVLEEMPYKMAWVDLLSGSYEFWNLPKVLKQDIERFWKTHQSSAPIEEAIAFYSLLPSSPANISFKRDYIQSYFQEILEQIDVDMPSEHMLREGFDMMKSVLRGIDAEDGIILIEKWREWAEDRAPDWFDDDEEFEDNQIKYKEYMERLVSELLRTRRWNRDQKQRLEQILLY